MRRIIVTGSTGLLGRAVYTDFSRTDQVEGWGWNRSDGGIRRVDLRSRESVETRVVDFSPDIVIHCAANRFPDRCEKDPNAAEEVNVAATSHLARVVEKIGAKMIYVSTDYVFDGTSPPYKESDTPNPLNSYGISKLKGEEEVELTLSDYIILRVSILYGPVEFLEESSICVLYKYILDNERRKMDDYSVRYPTYTSDVAGVMRFLLESGASGYFHFSGNEAMTKFEMVRQVAHLKGLSSEHIVPEKNPPENGTIRPISSHLDCSKLNDLGFTERTPFSTGIRDTLKTW